MPFKSKAQQKWMFANHPKMAKKWASHTPNIKSLPARKGRKLKGTNNTMDEQTLNAEDLGKKGHKKEKKESKKAEAHESAKVKNAEKKSGVK